MTKPGILLIIAAVAYLLVTIFSPDVIAPLGSLFCPAGQKLKSETVTYSRPGETDMNNFYHCVDSDNREISEVTGPVTLLTMGGFALLLVGGIVLTTIGARQATRSSTQANSGSYTLPQTNSNNPLSGNSARVVSWTTSANAANQQTLDEMMQNLQQGVIRFGGQEIHVNDLKSGNYQLNAQSSKRTLSETLKQLQDAHTQGLINDDEFQKLRQEALDKLI